MANEGYVQVAADGAGKQIRNFQLVSLLQPDGTTITAYVQVVSNVDKAGYVVDSNNEVTNKLLRVLIEEVRALRAQSAGSSKSFIPVGNYGTVSPG